jgi:hypothetical protein
VGGADVVETLTAGTYDHSYTWFDLALLRDGKEVEGSRIDFQHNVHGESRQLARLTHAAGQYYKEHQHTFDENSAIVKMARPGDRVVLWARAMYPVSLSRHGEVSTDSEGLAELGPVRPAVRILAPAADRVEKRQSPSPPHHSLPVHKRQFVLISSALSFTFVHTRSLRRLYESHVSPTRDFTYMDMHLLLRVGGFPAAYVHDESHARRCTLSGLNCQSRRAPPPESHERIC